MERKIWSTLGLRILAWVLVFNAVLSIIATAAQLYTTFKRQDAALHQITTSISSGFGDSISEALWSFDFNQVELLLQGVRAEKDIATVRLVDESGRTWSYGGAAGDERLEIDTIELSRTDERHGTLTLGTLELGLSRASIWSEIYAQMVVVFLSNMAKTGLASLILLVLFHRLVGRHLRQITRHVKEVDWTVASPQLVLDRPPLADVDDLDVIVEAVNDAKTRVASGITASRETASLLKLVLDTSSSGIIGLDQHGEVVSINPAARHMLGGGSDPTPFPWPSNIAFVDSEDMNPLDASANPIRRALSGQILRGEIAIMSRSGSDNDPRYVRLSSAPTPEDASSQVRTVVILDDVSEQEKNRQQVERSSRLDALGQLTGGIAHDFNNLLATIQYAVQLALQGEKTEESREYLTVAINAVDRGANLTNRLLAFAKRQPGLAKSTNVSLIMDEFKQLLSPTIEENITLEFIVEHEDLWVYCDVPQLENALLNLALNSRDSIIRSGVGSSIVVVVRGVAEVDVDVVLRREDPHSYIAKGMHVEHTSEHGRDDGRVFRYVEFAVTDNGPGMSEEVKRRAIDPFFTTKATNSGTGLGLSMVYGFIQQSNGELRIYSEIDHGTTIRMLLPRGTPAGNREEPVERIPTLMGHGQRILIVEDEEYLLRIMGDLVVSLGYEITTAVSGRAALELVESGEAFDLLLTDIVMPDGVGGFELARRLREIRPDLPIIYMSGYTGLSQEEMGDAIAPMIQKPCPPSELARVLNEAFKKSGGS